VIALTYYSLAAVVPCGKESGCHSVLEGGHETRAIIALVILGLALVFAIFAWIRVRWNRGPFAWLIRRQQR
jgi:hypothetical protein